MKELLFEWNRDKAKSNSLKHKVTFTEAKTVFSDPLAGTISDMEHSLLGEERSITVGLSRKKRLLVVVHYDSEDRIRIISARKATRKERKKYEEGY